jgi:hypothetical protein
MDSRLEEEIVGSKENSPPQPDFGEYTYRQHRDDLGVDYYRRK